MNELMEITREEYLELVNKIDSLQATLNSATTTCHTSFMSNMVKEMPIEGITPVDEYRRYPIFKFNKNRPSDTWKAFRDLARYLHIETPVFYDDAKIGYGRQEISYMREVQLHRKPPTTKQMTPEQKEISVQMLNEMIPIFNKYYKTLHSEVLYNSHSSQQQKLKVVDTDEV